MSTPYISEISIFAGDFAPRGWATCDGQLLPLAQNTTLYSLLGTYYGGNGTSNFALPDMRGRTPVAQGNGAGLSPYTIGESIGTESETLLILEMPQHNHQMYGGTASGAPTQAGGTPTTTSVFTNTSPGQVWINTPTQLIPMAPQAIGFAGGGLPHENRQPSLALTFIIATQGAYPARN